MKHYDSATGVYMGMVWFDHRLRRWIAETPQPRTNTFDVRVDAVSWLREQSRNAL